MRTYGDNVGLPLDGRYPSACDYCGVWWERKELRRDSSNRLACPDDYGRDRVFLDRANADRGRRRALSGGPGDGVYVEPPLTLAPLSPIGGGDTSGTYATESGAEEAVAWPDPAAPGSASAASLPLGAVSPTFPGWEILEPLEVVTHLGASFIHDSAVDGLLFARSEEDYRNVEITFCANIGVVYLRLSDGCAYYCSVHLFGSGVRFGYATGVGSAPTAETRYELCRYDAADIAGYPTTDGERTAFYQSGSFTFGIAGHELYFKFNGTEIDRFCDILHTHESGRVAIRSQDNGTDRGFARWSATPVVTPLWSNTILDDRDLRVKRSQPAMRGSIAAGSALLTILSDENLLEVGDGVIVEPTQSAGEDGPGGHWPDQSEPDEASFSARPIGAVYECAYAADTLAVFISDGIAAWSKVSEEADGQGYYWQTRVPRPLRATVIAVSGNQVTLDTPASAATTNARVFIEAFDELQGLVRAPTSYAQHGPHAGTVDASAIYPSLHLRFQAGIYATGQGPLLMNSHVLGDVIEGGGHDKTVFYAPDYCESAGIFCTQHNKTTIRGIGFRGTMRLHRAGWDMSTNIRPNGSLHAAAIRMSACTGCEIDDVESLDGWQDIALSFCGSTLVTNASVVHIDPPKAYMAHHVTAADSEDCVISLRRFWSNYRLDGCAIFKSNRCTISCEDGVNVATEFNASRNSRYNNFRVVHTDGARRGTFFQLSTQDAMAEITRHVVVGYSPDNNGYESCVFVSHERTYRQNGLNAGAAWIGGYVRNCAFVVTSPESYHVNQDPGNVIAVDGCSFRGGNGRLLLRDGTVDRTVGQILWYDPNEVVVGANNRFVILETF